MTPTQNSNFYCKGKFFDTFDEMMEYNKKWPDSPLDLAHYREFLDQRFKEAELNVNANPDITNRTIFKMLRWCTDWTDEVALTESLLGKFPEPSSIVFAVDTGKWIMRIDKTENGPIIRFNTAGYPNATPDDFSLAIIKVLCKRDAIMSFIKESLNG